jgi:hypothetical protein
MRAVIYLVSGVVLSVLLWPPQLACTLNPACPASALPAAVIAPRVANPDLLQTALLRGTNRVATDTLLQTGLAPDALIVGADLDADGDADEFHLRLELAPLGAGAEAPLAVVPRSVGPWRWQPPAGTAPGAAPTLQLEQDDRLLITLENPLALPLALQVDGLQATPVDDAGVLRAATALPPGGAQTYRLELPAPGDARYQVTVADGAQSGPQGLLRIAPNTPAREEPLLRLDWPLVSTAPAAVDTRVEDPMNAREVLHLSAFGLALGLALAGLAGLPWPGRRRSLQGVTP